MAFQPIEIRNLIEFQNLNCTTDSEIQTFRHRFSSICSHTSLVGFGHFHGSTQSSPIQVASTLGDCFSAVFRKVSGTQSRLSLSHYALKEFAAHGLHAPATEPGFDSNFTSSLSSIFSFLTMGFCTARIEFFLPTLQKKFQTKVAGTRVCNTNQFAIVRSLYNKEMSS